MVKASVCDSPPCSRKYKSNRGVEIMIYINTFCVFIYLYIVNRKDPGCINNFTIDENLVIEAFIKVIWNFIILFYKRLVLNIAVVRTICFWVGWVDIYLLVKISTMAITAAGPFRTNWLYPALWYSGPMM